MNIKLFIERPLLAIVINIMIATLGIIALLNLPLEKFPDIAPPSVYVWASYPGASADTIQKTVIAPLEQAINGVAQMSYMKSTAEHGTAVITIFFDQAADIDMAAVRVQNRIMQAQSMLPAEVLQSGISVEKNQPGQLRIIALESPNGTYDESFLTNYFYTYLRPALLRISDVGKVEIWGGQYALRIWLKPENLVKHKLMSSDIQKAITEQNMEIGIGSLGSNSENFYQYNLRYSGRKQDVESFKNIVITTNTSGEILRLKDVAEVELGQSDYSYRNTINGHPGVMGSISQTAGSNATRINQDIDDLLEKLKPGMPSDISIVTFDNTNDFLLASINEVIKTLLEAIILVLVVILIFVQSIRATLIPALSMAVSFLGTFLFMSSAGFTMNMITLFALVLVIGTIVDDSIVVVEAVQARFEAGSTSSKQAATEAMSGLTAALFTTTFVFVIIFIPVSMIGGTTGIFYRQFGLTMAVSVAISLITAVTLSPALASLILRPPSTDESLSTLLTRGYQVAFNAVLKKYATLATVFVRFKWLAVILIALISFLTYGLIRLVPTGFIPDEDMGAIFVDVTAPSGYTLNKTEEIITRVANNIQQMEETESVGSVVGLGGANRGMIYVQLKPWEQRLGEEHSSWSIIDRVNELMAGEHEAQSFAMAPSMIDGFGNGGFELSVLNQGGADIHTFNEVTKKYIEMLQMRPEVLDVSTSFDANFPQYRIDVDPVRCGRYGVSPATVLSELSTYLGSNYISDFNRFNQTYQVTLQLKAADRRDVDSIERLFVRSESGQMLPISQFITMTKEFMPQSLNNFNMISSIEIYGNVAPGHSSGEAIKAVQEIADANLPIGYSIEFSGITREEVKASHNNVIIFTFCLFFVYLIMVALYESLFIPLAVLLCVPFGLAGSFIFAWIFDIQNGIYFQVGLIMLIGLLAKTAILLTDYASQCRRAGLPIVNSALLAARVRLRPILMTTLTMVFGMLPLMFSAGVGSNGRKTIGTCIVGGEIFGTISLLFVLPTLFVIFQKIEERFKTPEFKPTSDTVITAEIKALQNHDN